MNKKLFISFIIIIILISSCSENLYDMIKVLDAEPGTSLPRIDHFAKESVIIIKWDRDKYADEYILYRDNDPEGNFSEIVYQGKNLEFEDDKVNHNCFYYYKLSKKRGNKIYPKSDYAYTVCNDVAKDDYEDNNFRSIDNLDILYDIAPNLYYFRDRAGNVLEDFDWYKTRLGPHSSLQLIITRPIDNSNLSQDELLIQRGADISSDTVIFDNLCSIDNNTDMEQDIHFKISFDDDNFSEVPLNNSNGVGKFGHYIIDFKIKLEN